MFRTIFTIGLVSVLAWGPAFGQALQPHRALYRVELADATASMGLSDANGLIGFEWTESCEAYVSSQRFFTRFVTSDGISSTSDILLSSEEAIDGSRFTFDIADRVNGNIVDHVAGDVDDNIIRYSLPIRQLGDLPSGTIFPSAQSVMLLQSALAGQEYLETRVYDGGEEDEVYDIVSRISGLEGMFLPHPDSEGVTQLADLASWAISMSYYTLSNEDGLPHYEVSYRMFSNGIIDELVMDYGEYAFRARLMRLDYLDLPSC